MLKVIVGNAGWLGLTQILNYGVPLVTLPLVTRAFGPGVFGIIATITAYAAYVGLLINYGFNYTGPRKVSLLRGDLQELSGFVSAVMVGQLVLAAVASATFMIALLLVRVDPVYKTFCIIILASTIAGAFTPQWIFIGLERMRDFSLMQLGFRVLAAGAIVTTIRSADDIILYAVINGLSAACVAVGSFAILARDGLRWRPPSTRAWIDVLREATGLFASTISINLYTTANVLIVGFVLGPAAAGPFALADRLRQAVGNILGPITSAIYPFACRIAGQDTSAEESKTKRLFFCIITGSSGLLSISLFIFSPLIVHFVGGEAFQQAVPVLRLMSPLPLVLTLSNIFGVQTMIPLRMDGHVAAVVSSAAVLGVGTMFVLTRLFGLEGAGLSVLLVELFVTGAMASILQRRMNVMKLFVGWT
jgi:PST family polysaccharide transporter